MPQSGSEVHQQLMDGYKMAQTRLEELRDHVNDEKQKRNQLDDERGEALVNLAEFYLPELTQDAIYETWAEVRPGLSQLLLQKQDHRSRLDHVIGGMIDKRGAKESELLKVNEELDAEIEERDRIAHEVEKQLREDAEFVQLSDRAAIAEAALERAESNLDEVEQDAAKKLPAYDNSKLFRYLQDRGFNTDQYTKRGFSRRMDRILAKFIGFKQAKRGYDFLRDTPEQMRKVIAEDREALDTVMDELERRRDQVAKQLGLNNQLDSVQRLEAQRDTVVGELDVLLAEFQEVQEELLELEDTRGPYYRKSIELFREMLERVDTRDLERRAKSTVDITDDQIVARLRGVEAAAEDLNDLARDHRHAIKDQQNYVKDFGRLVQKFRAARFDSGRSQFADSLDLLETLDRAQHSHDTRYCWERIRSAHRWGPTVMERVTDVATHPLTQVLINAMAYAAAGRRQSHARRAGERRARSRHFSADSSGDWSGDRKKKRYRD